MNCAAFFNAITILNIFSYHAVLSIEFKGQLPDPLTLLKIFNQYLKPVLRTLPTERPDFRSTKQSQVQKAIQAKLDELKEFLHDEDVKILRDENILLEYKDDTTIIEFLPKIPTVNTTDEDDDKNNLKKYEKLVHKINKSLKKEAVSEKTKQLITKTLDDLFKGMLRSQCKWKRNLRAKKNSEPYLLADRWNKGLNEIKHLFLNIFTKKDSRRRDISGVIDSIQTFLNSVAVDVNSISKRYKIQCEFVPKTGHYALRNNWEETDIEHDKCARLIICSNELNEFMQNFYTALNDTAVNMINNYIEMFMRDVSNDQTEKDTIVRHMKKMADNLEETVQDIFIIETQKLKVDKDRISELNLKHLSYYIRHTVRNVKNSSNILIKSKLKMATDNEKLASTITSDIKINMEIDFGNLEIEFITKICSLFHICNGKIINRRRNSEKNKRNLFVQLHLNFDGDISNSNSSRRYIDNDERNSFNLTHYNITRTTPKYNSSTSYILGSI